VLVDLKASSLFTLAGKTAFLTGASGFLGRMFTRGLLENGASVIAVGRSARLLEEAEQWKAEFGAGRIHALRVDMYNYKAFTEKLEEIAATYAVDVVINNAHELGPATGFNIPEGTLEKAPIEQWERNLAGGVYWPAMVVQKIGTTMKDRQRGSIINIATMYGLVAPRPSLYAGTNFMNPPGYSASKAAMLAFTRYVASFWGPFNVRSNAIVPGPFSNTEDTTPNAVGSGDPFIEKLKGFTSLGRIGRPQELVGALLFLASDASSYVTGQAIVVDGGWTSV
jgi:NAD(P)-dependent dehydrogenase (short-subunit alcohol dehydrogenase family)